MKEPPHVLTERQGGIGIITISRPDKRNALDAPTHDQLLAAFEAMKRDEAVRVVVLTGTGKAFVSGADVREFVGQSPVDMLGRLLQQPSAIEVADGFPKPLIAMINGYCLGTGNELAMACDIRIASEDAKFGQPEINLGMIPGGGATQRLPRLVGLGKALWMMYTGAILDSSDALRMGLVDLVVPPEQLRPRTMTLAQMIASKSAVALAMIKEAARASVRAPLDDGIRHEQSLASVVFSSKDMQEGLKAFLEKRQPRFTGE
ncbi:MAG: enoyl-CoA hydratase/isomerase family protein [Gemmatimonadales bacterium]|nr:enoyl-CoA hydratase/isomerase family protein [Gemmatimonadales bacterium]